MNHFSSMILRCLPLSLLLVSFAWAAPTNQDEVITPAAGRSESVAPAGSPGFSAFTAVAVVVLAGAGGWMLWRGKGTGFAPMRGAARRLGVEETRSLGNRQYLVVATYDNRKFLLGVCPGRIDLLSPLDATAPTSEPPRT